MRVDRDLLLTMLLASARVTASRFEVDTTAQQRAQEGKKQLERITNDPSARGCWASAVETLEAGCKAMDDAGRSKLAVQVRTRARSPALFFVCHATASHPPPSTLP